MMNEEQLREMSEAWHAPDCNVDAGGACILHEDLKVACRAGRLSTDPSTPASPPREQRKPDPATTDVSKREQVALQCAAVAMLAETLVGIRRDYQRMISSGSADMLLDVAGKETAYEMELLGDLLNDMDAVSTEDSRQLAPVFAEAQRLWPVS